MRYRVCSAVVLIPALAIACSNPPADGRSTADSAKPSESAGYLIDQRSMGGIRLGMTPQQVREAFPSANIQRTSDGEGVALIEITLRPGASVTAYAGEENAEAPIDWSKPITMIETFSETFHTAEGVHPGSPVTDVEKIYGMTKSTQTSEIESREYITFEKQPVWLTFRLDHTGVLPNHTTESRNPGPKGMIFSISISSP